MSSQTEPAAVLATLRRFLLAIVGLGLFGTGTELLLMGHYEDPWQLVPLVVIALSLAVLGWHTVSGGAASLRAHCLAMALLMISGALGIVLHYRGNMEFQLEIDASLRGLPLFLKVMNAKAPPALAPGNMALLGLLGLAYAYRHPAADPTVRRTTTEGA